MKNMITSLVFLVFVCSCASAPEIPDQASQKPAAPLQKTAPLIGDDLMSNLKTSNRWKRAVSRRIASRIRQVRQDCKIYQKPTLMSPNVSSVESGRDVWTEETDTSWFRVYKDKSFGYVSKICF